jgi:hypothetical protein
MLSWRSIVLVLQATDWQSIDELSTRICGRMTHALRWVGTEVREPPTFYGQNDLEEFLTKFELEVF